MLFVWILFVSVTLIVGEFASCFNTFFFFGTENYSCGIFPCCGKTIYFILVLAYKINDKKFPWLKDQGNFCIRWHIHKNILYTILFCIVLVRSGRIELPLSAPEANVLSTGLRAQRCIHNNRKYSIADNTCQIVKT